MVGLKDPNDKLSYQYANKVWPLKAELNCNESRGKKADLNWEADLTGRAKACLPEGREPEPGG
jgi:hypothetical protein